jgi:hypothetical protein
MTTATPWHAANGLCSPPAAAISHSRLELYEHAAHGLVLSHKQRLTADLITFVHS